MCGDNKYAASDISNSYSLKDDQIANVCCLSGVFISRRAIICFDLLFDIKHNNNLQSNIAKD